MTTGATIIEVGEVAAGLVVREGSRHVRFHAAIPPVAPLDRRLFRSAREVTSAAAALIAREARTAEARSRAAR